MSLSRSRAAVRTILRLVGDVLQFVSEAARWHAQLAAENLFLRKQLALYLERRVKPRRADDATRITSHRTRASRPSRLAIGFVTAIASSRRQFSADFTTSIVLSPWRLEPSPWR